MDTLRALAEVAGIGGVALGVVVLVYREIIRRNNPGQLGRSNHFKLLRMMTIAVWTIGLAGIVAWALPPLLKGSQKQVIVVQGDDNKAGQSATVASAEGNDTPVQQDIKISGKSNVVDQARIGAKP